DRLLPAVFVDLEVVGLKIGDEVAFPVGDGDAEIHQVDAAAEDGHLLSAGRRIGERGGQDRGREEGMRQEQRSPFSACSQPHDRYSTSTSTTSSAGRIMGGWFFHA